jgi:Zn-dependent M28 family amino/carboxypeptidase
MIKRSSGNIRFLNRVVIIAIAITFLIPITYIPMNAEAPGAPGYNATVQEIIDKVTVSDLTKYITDLQNFGTRYGYSSQCNLSAQYIFDEFSNYSALSVENDYFKYNGYVVRNVIATLPGLNDSIDTVYVVGGHYDSTSNDRWNNAPGADDDASGTTVALEAARVLSQYRFNYTIVFAAWTVEEMGLIGSERWVGNAVKEDMDIGAYLNFDMIGYNPSNDMSLDIGYNAESVWISQEMESINENYSIGLNITTGQGGGASDHASFWQWGYPAVECIESEFNTPNYHTVNDTIDKLNMVFDMKVTQLGLATLAKFAEVQTPGIGALYLDAPAYQPTDTITIKLYDTDINSDPGSVDFTAVQLSSDTETTPEPVFMVETGVNTSVFSGTIDVAPGLPVADSVLQVTDGDTVTASYNDASPAGVRIATAAIDGTPPVISNVLATPGVTTATITWTTDEPSDSQLYYGISPSLGFELYDSDAVTSHSITISGLEPSLTYYFDVESTDWANNTQRDDNGGLHHSFTTLLGVTYTTESGYVGYVKQSAPAQNFFTGPDILVGHGAQGNYHGAAQFNLSFFPNNADITKATVEFYGSRWYYLGSGGTWELQMLNNTIDAGWTGYAYAEIKPAEPEATIPPVLQDEDLAYRRWNMYVYDPAQYTLLMSHIVNNTISFRIDGPSSGYYLFIWDTGNGADSWGPEYAPRVTIAYDPVGDTEGPVISNLEAVPNPTYGATDVTLSAIISDDLHGNSNIVQARYYDPFQRAWFDMDPEDGVFNSYYESVQKSIDISSWPEGTYTIYVRGLDEAGNWGDLVAIDINCWQTFNIYLSYGWNLISIPNNLTDTTVSNVLSSINGDYDALQSYDITDPTKPWKHNSTSKPPSLNDFDNIDHIIGFWIHITEPSGTVLQCPGTSFSTNQMITLYPGWNMVGYPSSTNKTRTQALNNMDFGTDIDTIWTYNADKQLWEEVEEFDSFRMGRGYWIHSLVTKAWDVSL